MEHLDACDSFLRRLVSKSESLGGKRRGNEESKPSLPAQASGEGAQAAHAHPLSLPTLETHSTGVGWSG